MGNNSASTVLLVCVKCGGKIQGATAALARQRTCTLPKCGGELKLVPRKDQVAKP